MHNVKFLDIKISGIRLSVRKASVPRNYFEYELFIAINSNKKVNDMIGFKIGSLSGRRMKSMNYSLLNVALVWVVIFSFTFCKSDNEPVEPVDPVLSPSSVELMVNEQVSVSISGGVEPFSVSNVDVTKASVELSGRSIVITGIASGSFTATITGTDGGKATLSVTITDPQVLLLTPPAITLVVDMEETVSVSGGVTPYIISDGDPAIASATISGNIITVKGIATGTTTFNITGNDGGETTLTVTVTGIQTPVLTTPAITLIAGAEITVSINDGVVPYVVSDGDPAIASATVSGNVVTVKGIAAGTTSFNITGNDGGQAVLTVNVIASNLPEFVDIPAGSFDMGADKEIYWQKFVHTVTISAFKISKTEITNAQYCTFLNAWSAQFGQAVPYSEVDNYWNGETWFNYLPTSTAWFNQQIRLDNGIWQAVEGKEDYPMIFVSWYGAKAYCDFYGYSLPTEAEWEYAARGGAGDNFIYSGSDLLDEVAWWKDDSDERNYPVGQKKANGYGLFDMSGNVWEWCSDWFDQYYYQSSPTTNPTGPASGTERVIRGGGWDFSAEFCRMSSRAKDQPDYRSAYFGFRVCIR